MLEGIDIDLCNPFPFETSKAELSSMSLLESHDIESKKLAASVREEDAIKGELGGVAFVSGLAQLDGLVLMADGLVVHAFGVEITCTKEPPSILLATEESGTENPRALEYAHFGTRHRSMMRYCYANKGALGFVVSQDGDVRAMTRVGSSVIVWDRIKLQEIEPLLESLVSHEALPK